MPAAVDEPAVHVGIARRFSAYTRIFSGLTSNARRLLLATVCLWVGIGIFGVLFNLYLLALGHGVAFVGLLAALSTVGQASASFVLARFVRMWPARKVMAASTAVIAVTMAGSAVISQAIPLVLITLIQGAGIAIVSILASPFITEQAVPSRRAHLFAAYMGSTSFGSMVGSLISGVIPAFGALLPLFRGHALAQYRLGLLIGAAITTIGVLYLSRITTERVEEDSAADVRRSSRGAVVDESTARRDVLAMMLASALLAVALGAVYPLFNVYFSTVRHASTSTIGILYAVSGVVCVVASAFGPAAARRGPINSLVVTRALTVPMFLIWALHPPLAIVFAAYLGRNFLGQITGAMENTFSMEAVPPRLRASVANWRTFAFNSGWTAGSLGAGVVVTRFGFDPVFAASGVLTALGTFTWYRRFAARFGKRDESPIVTSKTAPPSPPESAPP